MRTINDSVGNGVALEVAAVNVLRSGSTIQPLNVPFLGYRPPRPAQLAAEQVALVLAVIAVLVAILFRTFIVAEIIAVIALLAIVTAQPWRPYQSDSERRSLLNTTLIVFAATLLSAGGALYATLQDRSSVHRTIVAPGRQIYGLRGTPSPTIFDLTGGECTDGADGTAVAAGTLTNLTSRTATFTVVVTFESGTGATLGSASQDLAGVPSNVANSFRITLPLAPGIDLRCYVTGVDVASS